MDLIYNIFIKKLQVQVSLNPYIIYIYLQRQTCFQPQSETRIDPTSSTSTQKPRITKYNNPIDPAIINLVKFSKLLKFQFLPN